MNEPWCPSLRYLGCQEVPGGSAVQYYSYGGQRVSVSLERCLPCFGAWHFAHSSQVLVITLPGNIPAGMEASLLQRLGMDLNLPGYQFSQGEETGRGRLPIQQPLRFCLQEIPAA